MVLLVWQPSGGRAIYGTSGATADFSCGAMVLSEHFRGSSLQQHVEIPKPQSPNSRLDLYISYGRDSFFQTFHLRLRHNDRDNATNTFEFDSQVLQNVTGETGLSDPQ
jgi:hypothetical protein